MVRLEPSAHERIRRAVEAARAATGARFELVVVPASGRYAVIPVLYGAVGALVLTGAAALLCPGWSIGTGVALQAALLGGLTLLCDWWPVRIRLAPRAMRRAAASRLAHREFAVRLVAATPARNGVLLFVSLAERQAEILADREIHGRVPEGTWERIVADLAAGMRIGEPADAFVAAIEACGAVLAAAVPAPPPP